MCVCLVCVCLVCLVFVLSVCAFCVWVVTYLNPAMPFLCISLTVSTVVTSVKYNTLMNLNPSMAFGAAARAVSRAALYARQRGTVVMGGWVLGMARAAQKRWEAWATVFGTRASWRKWWWKSAGMGMLMVVPEGTWRGVGLASMLMMIERAVWVALVNEGQAVSVGKEVEQHGKPVLAMLAAAGNVCRCWQCLPLLAMLAHSVCQLTGKRVSNKAVILNCWTPLKCSERFASYKRLEAVA